MVYAREVEGVALTLIVSGKLWRNSLIMQDEETGSLWSHVGGECLEGELLGRALLFRRHESGGVRAIRPDGREVFVQTAFWFAWISFHPNTEVVD